MRHDAGLQNLLDLAGSVIDQGDGDWVMMEVWSGFETSQTEIERSTMTMMTVGILPQEKIRARLLAIAQGQLKPRPDDPKIWFTSMRSLAEVLSDENRALLKVISQSCPDSIAMLAQTTGRSPGNLSRTLKTMSNYGLIEMQASSQRRLRPVTKATEFQILMTAF